MGVFRSETMKSGTLALPADKAAYFLNIISQQVNLEFQDMHANQVVPKRPYKKYVQRIEEMERIIRFLMEDVSSHGQEYFKNSVDGFLATEAAEYDLDTVETELKSLYNQFAAFKANNAKLIQERNAAIEEKSVVEVAYTNFGSVVRTSKVGTNQEGLLDGAVTKSDQYSMMFSNIAGVIAEEDQQRFARFVFRMSRGNTYTNFTPIIGSPDEEADIDPKTGLPVKGALVDPKTGKTIKKSVFVIFFQDSAGDKNQESELYKKIMKVATTFNVNVYNWPVSREDARNKLSILESSVKDKKEAAKAFDDYVKTECSRLLEVRPGGNSLIEEWRLFCIKEKSVYTTLNWFEGESTLRCSVWYPEIEEESVRELLVKTSVNIKSTAFLVTDKYFPSEPPTYFKSNDFTAPFQELVHTYGIPAYKEVTPALFTITTFPFIFGIMYGDVGHGGLLFLFGIWAVYKGDALKYSQPSIYFARYMLLMMGFFATYAGFLYNDFFGMGTNLFGTRWKMTGVDSDGNEYWNADYDILNEGGKGPYPFGIDPAWIGASNELLFLNSLKMKMSVLFGVAQMTMGLCIRFSNAIYERNLTDFICECCPMMVFMICFFGYMDYMILYKWVTPLETPPSLINSLISMAMFQPDDTPLWPGAAQFASKMMTCALLSAPWLLLPKPIILYVQHKMKSNKKHDELPQNDDDNHGHSSGGHGHGEFDIGEIAIHQIIETIEYVLGTVSHTASYLRQWALSLAHQQLSIVFFQKTLTSALEMPFPGNCIGIFCGFTAWFMITLGVLLGMDVLECFLHTLRLHWVEFQSKFFKTTNASGGMLFTPYNQKLLLETS